MKSYKEISDRVFSRGDEILAAQKRRSSVIRRTAAAFSGIAGTAAAVLIGLAVWNNDAIKKAPDLSVFTSNTETTAVTAESQPELQTEPITDAPAVAEKPTENTEKPTETAAVRETAPHKTKTAAGISRETDAINVPVKVTEKAPVNNTEKPAEKPVTRPAVKTTAAGTTRTDAAETAAVTVRTSPPTEAPIQPQTKPPVVTDSPRTKDPHHESPNGDPSPMTATIYPTWTTIVQSAPVTKDASTGAGQGHIALDEVTLSGFRGNEYLSHEKNIMTEEYIGNKLGEHEVIFQRELAYDRNTGMSAIELHKRNGEIFAVNNISEELLLAVRWEGDKMYHPIKNPDFKADSFDELAEAYNMHEEMFAEAARMYAKWQDEMHYYLNPGTDEVRERLLSRMEPVPEGETVDIPQSDWDYFAIGFANKKKPYLSIIFRITENGYITADQLGGKIYRIDEKEVENFVRELRINNEFLDRTEIIRRRLISLPNG